MRRDSLQEALANASGTGAPAEVAKAIFAAVGEEDKTKLLASAARLTDEPAASKAALADAMLKEASKQTRQIAHNAMVRGAMKANVLLNALRIRRNIRISPKFRKAVKQKPQAVPQQD